MYSMLLVLVCCIMWLMINPYPCDSDFVELLNAIEIPSWFLDSHCNVRFLTLPIQCRPAGLQVKACCLLLARTFEYV